MITPAYAPTATERVLPRLALDFTTGVLDSRVTVTRALNTATRVNSSGLIEGVNANLPRFDYDPVTLAPKGLLIEETRANLLLRSSEFSVSPWTPVSAVITPDTATAPDGTSTADTIAFSGAGQYILQNVAITLNTVYTISFYIRTVTGTSNIKLVTDGGVSVSSNIPVTTQWQRITFTSTASRTSGGVGHGLESVGASSFYIWGAQLEAGAFATSYIPTTTTSLTRNADVVSMTGTNFSSWYNASEGTFVTSFIPQNVTIITGLVSASDGTTNNQVYMARDTTASTFSVRVTNASQCFLVSGTLVANALNKVCGGYKLNDFGLSANAAAVAPDTAGTTPTVNRLTIGSSSSGTAAFLNGHMQDVLYYQQKLISAEIQASSK